MKTIARLQQAEADQIAFKAEQAKINQIANLKSTAAKLKADTPDASIVAPNQHHHKLVAAQRILETKLAGIQKLILEIKQMYSKGKISKKAFDGSFAIYEPQEQIYLYAIAQYKKAIKISIS